MRPVSGILKLALIYGIVFQGIYGILLLIVPVQFVAFTGGAAFDVAWVRWAGGMLLAFAFGQFLVLNNPAKQGIFVMTIALATLLAGIGILISLVLHEYSAHIFWVVMPMAASFLQAILFYLGYQSSRNVL